MGSAIGVQWLHDVLRNRKPTDMTNPVNAFRALMGSGFGGFLASLGSNAMNLHGRQNIGTAFPAAKPVKSVKRIMRTAEKEPELFWYQVAEEARSNSGIGNLWYARGLTNRALQSMLLSDTQARQMDLDYERWVRRKDKKEKKKIQELFR